MVEITVDGEKVDVTECAISKCGSMPRDAVMNPFKPMSKNDRDASRDKRKVWFQCVNTKCHPNKPVVESAPAGNTGGKSTPSVTPVNTDNRVSQPQSRPPENIEEGWFKRNQTWVIVGGIVVVLGVGGLITYKALK